MIKTTTVVLNVEWSDARKTINPNKWNWATLTDCEQLGAIEGVIVLRDGSYYDDPELKEISDILETTRQSEDK